MLINIRIVQGDICGIKADAIVNAANNQWLMGGGVAGAIKRKGGNIIEKEAVAQGSKPVGEVVVTTAGTLPAKYVIHAAVMAMDFETDEQKIRQATKNTLKKADELRINSIALPAFGTGVGGFPLEDCARIMLDEIAKWQKSFPKHSLKEIIFVLWGASAFATFSSALEIKADL